MEAAAMVLLVCGVGVGYGWQPMPDGSPRYEYLVQVEPELLATLQSGPSIPIVSDVPDEVQPIGRIRIVVGSGELPRQKLTTHLKPAGAAAPSTDNAASASPSGVELAQFNQYGQPVYQQPAPAPQYAQPAAATGRYAQPADAAASDAAAWNGGDATAATPPREGAGGAWNDDPAAVAGPDDAGPMGRVGDAVDHATEPIRDGLNRAGQRVRSAAENLGDRTRDLTDELTRPFEPRPRSGSSEVRVAPPALDPNQPAAPTWNADAPAEVAANPSTPRYAGQSSQQESAWNEPHAEQSVLSQAPRFAPPADGVDPRQPGWPASSGATAPSSTRRLDTPLDPRDVGRWDGAGSTAAQIGSASRTQSSGSALILDLPSPPSGRAAAASPNLASEGPRLPGFEDDRNIGQSSERPAARRNAGNSPSEAFPAIESGMLSQAPTRPLEGVAAGQSAVDAASGPAFPAPPAAAATAITSPATPAAAGQGWDWAKRDAAAKTPAASTPVAGPPDAGPSGAAVGGRSNPLTVLLAWVLLSGSAAGNLYLFWSYQDIRHKYRVLVRKTARAVGGRLSAA